MKKLSAYLFILFLVAAISTSSSCAQSLPDNQIRQQLLEQPPAPAVADAQQLAKNGVRPPIEVDWLNADLDASGGFKFLIARFNVHNSQSGYLRVFELRDKTLFFRGDQEKPEEVAAGPTTRMYLADANSDGLPEVKIDSLSQNAADHYFSMFGWTGSSLHNLFGEEVMNGNLADIDGDGVSEIVLRGDAGQGFDVYKLTGMDYHFDKTFASDPTGLDGANGTINYVRAFCKALDPDRFPISAIRQALEGRQQAGRDSVHFRFGGLEKVNGGPVDLNQIDQATIRVSHNLQPLRISLQAREPAGSNAATNQNCQRAAPARMDVEIARTDFLRGLQRLKLDGPLTGGEQLEIRLTGRLLDGTPFSAVFSARVNSGNRN